MHLREVFVLQYMQSLYAILGPVLITLLGEHATSTLLVARVPHDLPVHHAGSLEHEEGGLGVDSIALLYILLSFLFSFLALWLKRVEM